MSINVQLVPPVLPEGLCFASEQERANAYFSEASASVEGFAAWNIGTTTPTVDNQGSPWLKLNSGGYDEGVYMYLNGAWVRPYEIPPGTGIRQLWADTLVALDTYDGGSVGAVTDTTGPFWEVDSAFDGKIPRGPDGTVAVNVDASELSSGASATDQVRGIYFIKRTARTLRVG